MGKIFGERWEVIDSHSEGGQAFIYIVKDLKGEFPGQMVLKRLKNHNRLNRFKKEIEAGQRLNHLGIAPIHDYSLEEPAFFVTKKYEGKTLENLAPMDKIKALDIYVKLCDILTYAHSMGVIHRDLKPENVILEETGNLVVLDFGLCYFDEGDDRMTATMEQVGSRFYIAPEMESGRASIINEKIDIYALGKIMYFLLTGKDIAREEFRGKNEVSFLKGDNQLKYITDRILAYSIAEKPENRLDLETLRYRALEIRRLVMEHFYPGQEGSLCRFCGEGVYHKGPPTTLNGIRIPGYLTISASFEILVCNNCKNVQWFASSENYIPK